MERMETNDVFEPVAICGADWRSADMNWYLDGHRAVHLGYLRLDWEEGLFAGLQRHFSVSNYLEIFST